MVQYDDITGINECFYWCMFTYKGCNLYLPSILAV